MLSITFRGTGAWGAGKGSRLTIPEMDDNFYVLRQALQDLIDNPPTPNEIAGFEVDGARFTVVMDDGSRLGPLPLPVIMIRWRSTYQVGAFYQELDIFTVPNLGVFMVLQDHVGEDPFDPNLVDSNGPFYQQLWGEITSTATDPQDGDLLVFDAPSGLWINRTLAEVLAADSGNVTDLNSLTDVVITDPQDGDVPTYDSGSGDWVNRQPAAPGGGDSGDITDLASLTDVEITSPLDDDELFYDGTAHKWKNRAPSDVDSGGSGGGGGISFNPRGAWDGEAAYDPGDVALVTDTAGTKARLCYSPVSAPSVIPVFETSYNSGGFTYGAGNTQSAVKTSNGGWQVSKLSDDLTGKVYFEASVDAVAASHDNWGIGLVNENFTTQATDFAGHDGGSNGLMCSTRTSAADFWYAATQHADFAGAQFSVNDRIGFCFDKPNGRFWIRDITRDAGTPHWWGANNTGTDDPTTPSTGFPIATLAAGSHVRIAFSADGSAGVATATAYTIAADLIGAIPSGFSPAVDASPNPAPDDDPDHWI